MFTTHIDTAYFTYSYTYSLYRLTHTHITTHTHTHRRYRLEGAIGAMTLDEFRAYAHKMDIWWAPVLSPEAVWTSAQAEACGAITRRRGRRGGREGGEDSGRGGKGNGGGREGSGTGAMAVSISTPLHIHCES